MSQHIWNLPSDSSEAIRVGFDRQTFLLQEYGGVSRYFRDLYLGLLKIEGIDPHLLFNWHSNAYLKEINYGKILPRTLARKIERYMLKKSPSVRICDTKKIDIQHSTFYLGKPRKPKNSAVLFSTIHDMTPELMPHYFPKGNPHKDKINWLQNSDVIISNSKCTANDLCTFQPNLEKKIRVIHLCSSFNGSSPMKRPAKLPEDMNEFVLFVGKRAGYKNAKMLYKAFAKSNICKANTHLICAGSGRFSPSEQKLLCDLGITSKVHYISASEQELWHLYNHASATLVPSLAEGFSLPLVESLCGDTRVICSNIAVHNEIASDYATIIDPDNESEWVDALNNIGILARPSQRLGINYKSKCEYFSSTRLAKAHSICYASG